MQRIYGGLVLLLLLVGGTTLNAQTAAKDDFSSLAEITTSLLDLEADEDWSIYTDTENHILYVDFAKLNFNLNDITIRNKAGEILFQDQLWDLPVDTIYELDLAPFGKGAYSVELRSFTDSVIRDVEVE
ncbi:MAG: hypothetical protein KDC24_13520 [Saprospiraceae bacterium]|nr:hypothetical protein [Saprospiraceae bacterium]